MTLIYIFRNESGHEVSVVAKHLEEAIAKASPLCRGGMELTKKVAIPLARKDLQTAKTAGGEA